MTGPVLGEPAWLPDPTGRHQHRWWDGDRFTDRVADDGTVGVDAGASTPEAARPPAPSWPVPPPGPAPRSRVPLLLVAAGVVLVLGGGAAFVLTRDGGGGTGTFTGSIDGDVGTHDVSLAAGDALLVTLRPGDDLDALLGVLVDGPGADALDDAYEGLDYLLPDSTDRLGPGADDLDDDLELVHVEDLRFAGEPEQLLLAVGEDVDVTVVVAPFDPEADADDYEITIEVVPLEVDEGADGEELLAAVEDAEDVPRDFREIAESVLEDG